MSETNELDFTIEFNSNINDDQAEASLFAEADNRLRKLAGSHDDMIGASVNIRMNAKTETPTFYEATAVAYIRPENLAATEKADNPDQALDGALDALERQVRQKRERLRERWERPNDPITPEMKMEMLAAEEGIPPEELDIPEENENE